MCGDTGRTALDLNALHLVPTPVSAIREAGSFTPKSHIIFRVASAAADVCRSFLETLPGGHSGWSERLIIERVQDERLWASTGDVPTEFPQEADGYILWIKPDGIQLSAASVASVRYALRTLLQYLSTGDEVPAVTIRDYPALPNRAVMIDMARLKEKDHTYFDLLDEIAAWKMNALFLHFTDNQGCTIELKSHPELTSRHAMSQYTLRHLLKRAEDLGVRVIPEVEPWGHSRWISNYYPHLREPDTNSLCLAEEGIYPLLEDIIAEVASLFPDPCMHIGCDEADYFKHEACRDLAGRIGVDAMIANHINRVNRMAKRHGKTSMIWADVVVRYDGVLKLLDTDIVTEEWSYHRDPSPDNVRKLRDSGFQTWAAPSLMYGGWRLTPSQSNLDNVKAYTAIARQETLEGVATTVWLPQRYIPGSLGPGLAWAAEQAWGANSASLEDTLAGFLQVRFGLPHSADRVSRLARLISLEQRNPVQAFWPDAEHLMWHGTSEARDSNGLFARKVRGLGDELRTDLALVKMNSEDYAALILVADVAEHMANRRAGGEAVASHLKQALEDVRAGLDDEAGAHLAAAAHTILTMEDHRQQVWRAMQKQWDLYRYEDDPFRSGEGDTNSLYWWVGNPESYGYSLDLAGELEILSHRPNASFLESLFAQAGRTP